MAKVCVRERALIAYTPSQLHSPAQGPLPILDEKSAFGPHYHPSEDILVRYPSMVSKIDRAVLPYYTFRRNQE